MHMQLLIDQTTVVESIGGEECQRWEGTAPNGGRFAVWVHSTDTLDAMAEAYARDCLFPDDPPGGIDDFRRAADIEADTPISTGPRGMNPRAVQLTIGEITAMVANWVVDTEAETFETRSQAMLVRAVKSALEDGEPIVAMTLMLVIAARSAEKEADALTALSLALGDLGVDLAGVEVAAGNAERPAGD
jgi:hypothetical protein